jgi:hypothetical protein
MSESTEYRVKDQAQLRVLFCFGVTPAFFDLPGTEIGPTVTAIKEAFADLAGRFGVRVLGTLDDDELMVGPSLAWPWTAYVLADAPDLEAVTSICSILRDTEHDGGRLWRFMRVEARVGRPLFFGQD